VTDTESITNDVLDELEPMVKQKVQTRLQEHEKHDQTETEEQQETVEFDVDSIHEDKLQDFLDRAYLLEEVGDQEYRFAVPTFVTEFQVGKFIGKAEDGRFNIFLLDPATKTLHGIPRAVQQDPRVDIDLEDDRFDVRGNYIYYDTQHRSELEDNETLNKHLAEIGDTAAEIKHGHEFALLEALLNEGFDPFTPQPVDDEDLRSDPLVRDGFELRPYQQDWVDQVLDEGHGCFVGPTGSGKSYPTLYLFAALKGLHVLICYGRMTVDQWHSYLDTETQLDTVDLNEIDLEDPDLSGVDVIIGTYHSVEKLHQLVQKEAVDELTAVATDESHALGADTFAAAATLPSKYTWGMTATPYREDGRTYAIQAFTGPYVGMDWDHILELQGKDRHQVHIHVVDDEEDKLEQARNVYGSSKKTLVFTDSLDMGEDLSEAFNCSFVHGDTTNQYDTVVEAIERDGKCVVSRVGDHGLSIDGLEAIIEVDFLFGSRKQQLQRTGRLLHGYEGKEHHVVFTENEWEKHHKRVFSLLDREFNLVLPDGVEIPDEYEDSQQLDMDVSVDDRVDPDTGANQSSSVEDLSPIEFLTYETEDGETPVKDEVDARAENSNTTAENCRKAIAVIAKSGPVKRDDIQRRLDVSERTANRAVSPFRNKEPPLVKRNEEAYVLNTDTTSEIIQAQKERQEAEQLTEDLWG